MMRGNLTAAIAALCLLSALRQAAITIDESKIRTDLKNHSTVVTIPIHNSTNDRISARLVLQWLHENNISTNANREIDVAPGQSSVDVPMFLRNPTFWTRLKYSLTPNGHDAISGIVGLPQIAEHLFEMKLSHMQRVRRGEMITIHARAAHPVSQKPVDVDWAVRLSIDAKEWKPVRTVKHGDGFIDFQFRIPPSNHEDDDDDATSMSAPGEATSRKVRHYSSMFRMVFQHDSKWTSPSISLDKRCICGP